MLWCADLDYVVLHRAEKGHTAWNVWLLCAMLKPFLPFRRWPNNSGSYDLIRTYWYGLLLIWAEAKLLGNKICNASTCAACTIWSQCQRYNRLKVIATWKHLSGVCFSSQSRLVGIISPSRIRKGHYTLLFSFWFLLRCLRKRRDVVLTGSEHTVVQASQDLWSVPPSPWMFCYLPPIAKSVTPMNITPHQSVTPTPPRCTVAAKYTWPLWQNLQFVCFFFLFVQKRNAPQTRKIYIPPPKKNKNSMSWCTHIRIKMWPPLCDLKQTKRNKFVCGVATFIRMLGSLSIKSASCIWKMLASDSEHYFPLPREQISCTMQVCHTKAGLQNSSQQQSCCVWSQQRHKLGFSFEQGHKLGSWKEK